QHQSRLLTEQIAIPVGRDWLVLPTFELEPDQFKTERVIAEIFRHAHAILINQLLLVEVITRRRGREQFDDEMRPLAFLPDHPRFVFAAGNIEYQEKIGAGEIILLWQ